MTTTSPLTDVTATGNELPAPQDPILPPLPVLPEPVAVLWPAPQSLPSIRLAAALPPALPPDPGRFVVDENSDVTDNVYMIRIAVDDGTTTVRKMITIDLNNRREPIVVTTDQDVVDAHDGVTSLREAVARANKQANGNVILFADDLKGKSIVLNGGEIAITHRLAIDGDIDGDGKADITIDGHSLSRIFNVGGSAANRVSLDSLTLANGAAGGDGEMDGGAIAIHQGASLVVRNSTISGSHGASGGAISVDGNLVIGNSLLLGNGAENGGAIALDRGAHAQLSNTTLTGNEAAAEGGAVFADSLSAVSFDHVTMIRNEAAVAGGGIGGTGGRDLPQQRHGLEQRAAWRRRGRYPLRAAGQPLRIWFRCRRACSRVG